MLFGPQQQNWRTRLARTANRLREEGVPGPAIETQLKAIAAGIGISGAAAGQIIREILSFANSPSNTEATTSPGRTTNKRFRTVDIDPDAKVKELEPDKKRVSRRIIPMENETNDQDMAETARAGTSNGAGGSGPHGRHETQVIMQQPHYGIPEVATVIFPFTTYLSKVVDASNAATMSEYRLKLQSLYNILPGGPTTDPSPGGAFVVGNYGTLVGGGSTWPNPLRVFPRTQPTTPSNTEAPQWREYYAKMYQHYTVLRTEWEVTFHNPRQLVNSDILIGHCYSAHKAGEESGNVVPASTTAAMEYFPGIKWDIVHSQGDSREDSCWLTLKGTYFPNQGNKNVRNDEDVKTWTAMGQVPSLEEMLQIFIGKAAFNSQPIRNTSILKLNTTILTSQ